MIVVAFLQSAPLIFFFLIFVDFFLREPCSPASLDADSSPMGVSVGPTMSFWGRRHGIWHSSEVCIQLIPIVLGELRHCLILAWHLSYKKRLYLVGYDTIHLSLSHLGNWDLTPGDQVADQVQPGPDTNLILFQAHQADTPFLYNLEHGTSLGFWCRGAGEAILSFTYKAARVHEI